MARRIKTDKQNAKVEAALEQILETQLQEDEYTDQTQENLTVDDLKRKIDELNSDSEFSASDADQVTDIDDSSENQEFIKQLKAANDDKGRPSVYQIFTSRSSSNIYITSTILSGLWLALIGAITYHLWGNSSKSWQDFFTLTNNLTLLSAATVPVALIWVFAKLFKNSKDLATMLKSLVSTHISNEDRSAKFNNAEHLDLIDNNIQRTFEKACELESLVQGEIQTLERSYSENEDKIRRLVAMLANERQAILEHADRVKSTLQFTSNEISTELSGVTDKITVNIETIADRLSQSLNAKTQTMLDNLKAISGSLTGEFIENIDEKGTTYLEQLEVIFDRVKQGIASHSSESVNLFQHKLSEIGDAATIIVNEFNNKFDDMDALLQHRSEESLQNFEQQLQVFTNIFNAIPDRLDAATKKALVECEKNLLALDEILSDQSKSAITSFITYSISIEEHTDKLTNLLDSRVTAINDSIKSNMAEFSTAIDNGTQELLRLAENTEENVANKVDNLEERIGALFDDRTKSIEEKFNDSNNQISKVINNESTNIVSSIQQQIHILSQHLNNIEQDFVEKLVAMDGHKDKQVEIIKQYNERLNLQLEEGLHFLSKQLGDKNEGMKEQLDNSLASLLSQQTSILDARIEKMREVLLEKDEKLGGILDTHLDNYEQKFSTSNALFSDEFNNHLNVLENYTQNLQEAIRKTEQLQYDLSAHLDNSVQHSIENLHSQTQNIGATLREDLNQTAHLLTQEAFNAKQYIDNINISLAESIATFEQGFSNAHENVVQGTQYLTENLQDRLNEINESIKNEADQTTQKMLQAGEYINNSLAQVSHEIEQRIHERAVFLNDVSSNVYEQIDTQLSKVGTSMNELKEYNDQYFIPQIDELQKTTDAVYNAALATNRALDDTKNTISNQVATVATVLKDQLTKENDTIINSIERRSKEISNSLQHFNSDISKNIISITNQLANSSNAIFTKTNEIISNIQNLTQNSDEVSQNLGESFKKHASLLSQAANLLDKTQNSFDSTINEKQRALNLLTSTFANKTDEIVSTINQCEKLLKNNFEHINKEAKTSLELFSHDIQKGLKEAIENFNNTSKNLKTQAQSIQQELKKASVNDTFVKTSQNTMKKAINKQAVALNNLANILEEKQPTAAVPPSSSNMSIKSIANGIIKAINPEILAKIWQNYRKDTVNIYPRELYTNDGIQFLSKVQQEYNNNPSFKQAVNNYIQDFEQILKNMNLQQNPNSVYNALQTNSGRVYTALAHITGRIK